MFCKNCFKKISNRSNFCKYCGAPVKQRKKIKEDKPNEEPPVQGPPPAPQKKEYDFKLRSEREKEFPIPPKYIKIGFAVVLVIAVVVVLLKSSVFQNPGSISYSDYIGVWQERGTDDVESSGGVRLEITDVDGGTMKISLSFYDGGTSYSSIVVKDIGATLKDGEAYYTFSNDGNGNSGNGVLTFKGRDIEWKSIINKEESRHYEVVKVKNDITDEETLATEAPTEATEESTEKAADGDYILPNSSTEALTDEDLQGLTAEELRIARNEIMARHGRTFNDPELAAYFESKDWYKGTIDPETFDSGGYLSDIELKNVDLIKSKE
ncbi:YARHG domain-containing protein [Anaerovorax odorimutans]|uniref:YARHG domain-containing protein n=1 Tax=Anaerovorax odorimutans TaxID=109327 RepID=A0ABT1RQ93_9FIRM|nr:YARHG domain-containing protein [Anaerovorax odorimutans]MCQ4637367.1 YARHG domain-containing protein [Anaerovorax odorimutans]